MKCGLILLPSAIGYTFLPVACFRLIFPLSFKTPFWPSWPAASLPSCLVRSSSPRKRKKLQQRFVFTGDLSDRVPVAWLYNEYLQDFCLASNEEPKKKCEFGKHVRKTFPRIRIRRLGKGGCQKSHYCGMRPRNPYGLQAQHLQQYIQQRQQQRHGAGAGAGKKNSEREEEEDEEETTTTTTTTLTSTTTTTKKKRKGSVAILPRPSQVQQQQEQHTTVTTTKGKKSKKTHQDKKLKTKNNKKDQEDQTKEDRQDETLYQSTTERTTFNYPSSYQAFVDRKGGNDGMVDAMDLDDNADFLSLLLDEPLLPVLEDGSQPTGATTTTATTTSATPSTRVDMMDAERSDDGDWGFFLSTLEIRPPGTYVPSACVLW